MFKSYHQFFSQVTGVARFWVTAPAGFVAPSNAN